MRIYGFEYDYVYDNNDTERIDSYKGFVLAEDYGGALYKIISNYKEKEELVLSIKLETINCDADNCIYVEDDEVFERIKECNQY